MKFDPKGDLEAYAKSFRRPQPKVLRWRTSLIPSKRTRSRYAGLPSFDGAWRDAAGSRPLPAACRSRSASAVASGEPEVEQLTFGILPLTDCAPIVVAHERGLFEARHQLERREVRELDRQPRCADQAEERTPRRCSSACRWAPPSANSAPSIRPLVVPWILNRNGQAITLTAQALSAGKFEASRATCAPSRRSAARRAGQWSLP